MSAQGRFETLAEGKSFAVAGVLVPFLWGLPGAEVVRALEIFSLAPTSSFKKQRISFC